MLFSKQESTIQKTHLFVHIKIMELAIVGKKQAREVCDKASLLSVFREKMKNFGDVTGWKYTPFLEIHGVSGQLCQMFMESTYKLSMFDVDVACLTWNI